MQIGVAGSLLIGLGAMVGFGLANAFAKPLIAKYGAIRTLFLRQLVIVAVILLIALPAIHSVENWKILPWAILLGVFGYFPLLSFLTALKHSPVGLVSPIAGTSPLILVLLSSLFLGAHIKPHQWLAIALVVAANVFVSLKTNSLHSHTPEIRKGIPFAILACLGWGVFFFLYASVARQLGPWIAAAVNETIILLMAAIHLRLLKSPLNPVLSLQRNIIFQGLLICAGSLFFTFGSKYAVLSIFMPLSQSTAVISALAGMWLYREKLHLQQRVATIAMFVGVAILVLP